MLPRLFHGLPHFRGATKTVAGSQERGIKSSLLTWIMREGERRLGLAERLAGCIDDPRTPERVRHGIAAILRFRMLMIAAGYEDGNNADSLRHDPVFKLALDHLPGGAALCSQPTISRTENLPGTRSLLR